ncbi:MAG: pyrimidine/purine nucleoside phosphorylase [Candidatus Cloacimonetes bacterium]|nr:pyrimidine/purine nucleoside phosphorylase [Candidatus Cloacimonadota bacterium]
MFKVNEYFEGKVMSLGFKSAEGRATIGVMAAGEYEFGTSTVEYMTVTSGEMMIKLPGETEWKTYKPFETFVVAKDVKFKVKVLGDTSYKCVYK